MLKHPKQLLLVFLPAAFYPVAVNSTNAAPTAYQTDVLADNPYVFHTPVTVESAAAETANRR